jgi:hypothetical protein
MIGNPHVRIEYLFEFSVVVLLEYFGSVALFAIVARSMVMFRSSKIVFWIILMVFALLSLADTVLGFYLSSQSFVRLKAGTGVVLSLSRFEEQIMSHVKLGVATGALELFLALLIVTAVVTEWVSRKTCTKRTKVSLSKTVLVNV